MAACDGSALALPAKTPVDNTAAVRAPARIKPARPTLVLEAVDIGAMPINSRTRVVVPMTVGHRTLAAGSSGKAMEVYCAVPTTAAGLRDQRVKHYSPARIGSTRARPEAKNLASSLGLT
jgi:hypothetical protein